MSESPYRLGYVDLDLDNFHADVYLERLRGDLAARGFRVAACFGLQTAPSQEWARKNDVPFVADADVMNQMVDGYMILAPSNPEVHLALFERVMKYGRPVFVDKPFAPDAATAHRIFQLADAHGVMVQTSSALRYTGIQQRVRELGSQTLRHVVSWCGGRSFEEYGIHATEIAVSCLGGDALEVACRRRGDFTQLLVNFSGGRTAVINVACKACPFYGATLVFDKTVEHHVADGKVLFRDAASGILDFFAAGRPQIDRAETMAIRRILDAAEPASRQDGYIRL